MNEPRFVDTDVKGRLFIQGDDGDSCGTFVIKKSAILFLSGHGVQTVARHVGTIEAEQAYEEACKTVTLEDALAVMYEGACLELGEVPDGYFMHKYELEGSDWIRRISPEDRQALAHIGQCAAGNGVLGGRARAATAKRDARGRFV